MWRRRRGALHIPRPYKRLLAQRLRARGAEIGGVCRVCRKIFVGKPVRIGYTQAHVIHRIGPFLSPEVTQAVCLTLPET
jgi:hypothetical protein